MDLILFIMLISFLTWPIWTAPLEVYWFWVHFLTVEGCDRRRAYYEAMPWRVMKTFRSRRINGYETDMMSDGELVKVRYTIGYERPSLWWYWEMRFERRR